MIVTVQVVLAGENWGLTLGGHGKRLGVVEYTIDHNRDPLRVVIRGEITLPEMTALHEELFKDIGGRFRRVLMDITAARIAMSDDELRERLFYSYDEALEWLEGTGASSDDSAARVCDIRPASLIPA